MNSNKIKEYYKKANKFVVEHIILSALVAVVLVNIICNFYSRPSFDGTWENRDYDMSVEIDGDSCKLYEGSEYERVDCEFADGKLLISIDGEDETLIAEIVNDELLLYGEVALFERD